MEFWECACSVTTCGSVPVARYVCTGSALGTASALGVFLLQRVLMSRRRRLPHRRLRSTSLSVASSLLLRPGCDSTLWTMVGMVHRLTHSGRWLPWATVACLKWDCMSWSTLCVASHPAAHHGGFARRCRCAILLLSRGEAPKVPHEPTAPKQQLISGHGAAKSSLWASAGKANSSKVSRALGSDAPATPARRQAG